MAGAPTHARGSGPFLRSRAGIAPGDLRSLSNLTHFPTLDRSTCATHWADLPALNGTAGALRDLVVVSSSGSTGEPVRETVTRALGAPIFIYYGITETGPIAWECLEHSGRFHVLLPDVFVEEVGGELLVTRLRPSVLPLLRYRTGDAGGVVQDPCACGYHGLTILGFKGRSVCLFERPDGAKIDAWRLIAVLKYTRLRAFRLTQEGPQDFCLEIGERVPDTTGDIGELTHRLVRAHCTLGWNRPLVRLAALAQETKAAKPAPFRAHWTGAAAGPTT